MVDPIASVLSAVNCLQMHAACTKRMAKWIFQQDLKSTNRCVLCKIMHKYLCHGVYQQRYMLAIELYCRLLGVRVLIFNHSHFWYVRHSDMGRGDRGIDKWSWYRVTWTALVRISFILYAFRCNGRVDYARSNIVAVGGPQMWISKWSLVICSFSSMRSMNYMRSQIIDVSLIDWFVYLREYFL